MLQEKCVTDERLGDSTGHRIHAHMAMYLGYTEQCMNRRYLKVKLRGSIIESMALKLKYEMFERHKRML